MWSTDKALKNFVAYLLVSFSFLYFFVFLLYSLCWWDLESESFNLLLTLILIWEYIHLNAHNIAGTEN